MVTARRWGRGRAARQFRRNRAAVVALAFLVLLGLIGVLASLLAPEDPAAQELSARLSGPSGDHWLGTDSLGRDVLSRLLYSTRVSLLAVAQALSIAVLGGIPLGILAGSVGGVVDAALSRVADALLSLPPLILALSIVGILGPGLTNAMVAVGVIMMPSMFRVARSAATSVSNELYIEGCRAAGCTRRRLLARHVLPNASSPLLVQVTFAAGVAIIAEASLSFLGLGVQAPDSSWGTMLGDAFVNINKSPWFMLAPAAMIALTILAFSTLGDGLRDALEGRGRGG